MITRRDGVPRVNGLARLCRDAALGIGFAVASTLGLAYASVRGQETIRESGIVDKIGKTIRATIGEHNRSDAHAAYLVRLLEQQPPESRIRTIMAPWELRELLEERRVRYGMTEEITARLGMFDQAATVRLKSGAYHIFLGGDYANEYALEHELCHIRRGHFRIARLLGVRVGIDTDDSIAEFLYEHLLEPDAMRCARDTMSAAPGRNP